MITYRKKLINPLALKPEDIDFWDILQGLTNICRFGGQCPRFYSVLEHTLLVTDLVDESLKLHALLHDAAEAYLGDIIRPIKSLLCFVKGDGNDYYANETLMPYSVAEKRALATIYEAFEFPRPTAEQEVKIREADGLILRMELFRFFGKEGEELLKGDSLLPTEYYCPISKKTTRYDDSKFDDLLEPTFVREVRETLMQQKYRNTLQILHPLFNFFPTK
jgi:hypothetical protein